MGIQIDEGMQSGDGMQIDDRYSRQVLFKQIGAEGQKKLSQSRVAIVGCGATGSALASLLARAGVGTLRILDRDYVEPSNLQRQTLFDENDARESVPKAIAAARQIARFNSEIVVEPQVADLVPANVDSLLGGVRPDPRWHRQFRNPLPDQRLCGRRTPWLGFTPPPSAVTAVTMNILPGETACLACIFPGSPRGTVDTCETAGILNSAVNLVASLAATETLKFLVGDRSKVRRTLLSWDVWTNERAELAATHPRADCRACSGDFVHLAGEGRPHITLCGRNSVQIHERQRPVDFAELSVRLQPHGPVRHNEFVLKFWRDPYEMTLFPDGRAIIKGTTDTAIARSLYARFVGS